ncbi:MAG TPA: hypothetical protein VNZ49_05035, partial [Bacteroidia bacterium]|nr:hypothetical protein [Bacteroidia bacterium]
CFKTYPQSFNKKQIDFCVGSGFFTTFYTPGAMPLVTGSFAIEYGLTNSISLGAIISRTKATRQYDEKEWVPGTFQNNYNSYWQHWSETHSWSILTTGLRLAYHFNNVISNKKIDLFSGVLIGYNFVNYSASTSSPHHIIIESPPNYNGGLIFGGFVGCRYRFNEQAGIFAEGGYGIAFLTLGLNYKITFRPKKEI